MRPDHSLLELCRTDNRKAHHELYVMCFPVLISISGRYYINREDRFSVLNMIFLKLITNMADYLKKKETVEFEAWVRRIAINYIIDEFRSIKRYRETFIINDVIPDENHPLNEQINQKYNEEEIIELIKSLPVSCRTVFNLYAIDGYKHEEIAALLGISIGTSKAHLFKARKKLQELLQGVNQKTILPKTTI